MEQVTVTFGLRDLMIMVGIGTTAAGIGVTFGRMRSEFDHLRKAVARLEAIVTNGLNARVENIERSLAQMARRKDDRNA